MVADKRSPAKKSPPLRKKKDPLAVARAKSEVIRLDVADAGNRNLDQGNQPGQINPLSERGKLRGIAIKAICDAIDKDVRHPWDTNPAQNQKWVVEIRFTPGQIGKGDGCGCGCGCGCSA